MLAQGESLCESRPVLQQCRGMDLDAEILIVGAGAAGLMAAISAGRTNPRRRIVLLDGSARIGAKILISGGGRCNVTHDQVDETSFFGSTRPAIRKVLRRFDVPQTIRFFGELGVELKREETGKLFPVADRAQTVLDALLKASQTAGVLLMQRRRVESISRTGDQFRVQGPWGSMAARKVVLATGGQSVPKTGSDGHGYDIARGLGHSVAPLFPALVPLLLPRDHFLCELSGLSTLARLEVRAATGKQIASFTDSTLCAHFGLTGPAVLDISRHYLAAIKEDPQTQLVANWLPAKTQEEVDATLRWPGPATVLSRLRGQAPERLLRAICTHAGTDPAMACSRLTRRARQSLLRALTRMALPVCGSRGFAVAEATAGGVLLQEINTATMESRLCPGLYLCGEICDVDGRIGGYNFQWAWASGYVAGRGV